MICQKKVVILQRKKITNKNHVNTMKTLQTSEQTLAAILAVAAIAEKDFNPAEQSSIVQIGEALGCPTLVAEVERALSAVRSLQGEALAEYLINAAKAVVEGEEPYMMEAVLQVVLADKVLTYTESSNLLIIANALKMSHDIVLLMLADMMRENSDITVKFEV